MTLTASCSSVRVQYAAATPRNPSASLFKWEHDEMARIEFVLSFSRPDRVRRANIVVRWLEIGVLWAAQMCIIGTGRIGTRPLTPKRLRLTTGDPPMFPFYKIRF